MRFTTQQGDSWIWRYQRRWFFAFGIADTRWLAIRRLLEMRKEAKSLFQILTLRRICHGTRN